MALERNSVDLEFLILRWSVETHTFVALWREFCPSLEDVAMFISLTLFDEAHGTSLYLDGADKKRIEFMKMSLSKSNYPANNATYLS